MNGIGQKIIGDLLKRHGDRIDRKDGNSVLGFMIHSRDRPAMIHEKPLSDLDLERIKLFIAMRDIGFVQLTSEEAEFKPTGPPTIVFRPIWIEAARYSFNRPASAAP